MRPQEGGDPKDYTSLYRVNEDKALSHRRQKRNFPLLGLSVKQEEEKPFDIITINFVWLKTQSHKVMCQFLIQIR